MASTASHPSRMASAATAPRRSAAAKGGGSRGPSAPAQALQALAGNTAVSGLVAGGWPLPPALRADMEMRFGADFAGVRIHDDARAHAHASALHAKAFTHGEHIVFGEHRFAPQAGAGRRLLAHELAHVVQQRRGGAAPLLDAGAPHEQAADSAADAVAAGQSQVSVGGATGVGIARDEEEGWGAKIRRKYREAKEAIPPAYRETMQKAADATADVAVDALVSPLGPAAMYEAHGAGSALLHGAQKAAAGEPGATDEIKGFARDKVQEGLGAAKGVATQVTEVVDTAMWVGGEYKDARDKAAEKIGGKPGTWGHAIAKKAIDVVAMPLMPGLPALADANEAAKSADLVDPQTGQASITAPMSARLNEWAESAEKSMGAAPRDPEMFSPMEKAEIASALGVQVALAATGAEEVKIAMNVIGAISGLRGIVESIRTEADWKTSPRFWGSVIGMGLSIVGLKHAKAAGKISTLLLKYGWVAAAIPPLAQMAADYWKLETTKDLSDEERRKLEASIKQGWIAAIHVIKDAILHVAQSQGGSQAKPPPEEGPPTKSLGAGKSSGGPPIEEGAKATVKTTPVEEGGGTKAPAKTTAPETTAPPVVAGQVDTAPATTARAAPPEAGTGGGSTEAKVVPIGSGKGRPTSEASKALSAKLARQPAEQAGTVTKLPARKAAGGPPPTEPAVQEVPVAAAVPEKMAVGQTHGPGGGGSATGKPGLRVVGGVEAGPSASLKPAGKGAGAEPMVGPAGGPELSPAVGGGKSKSSTPAAKTAKPPAQGKKGAKTPVHEAADEASATPKAAKGKTPASKGLPAELETRLNKLGLSGKQRTAARKALAKLAGKDPEAARRLMGMLEERAGLPSRSSEVEDEFEQAQNKLFPEPSPDGKFRQSPAADERARLEQPRPTRKQTRKAKVAESERLGVEGGTEQAKKDGYKVSKTTTPQQFKEPFGKGMDARGSRGSKRQIFEFKGGRSRLGKSRGVTEMSSEWAGRKIAELEVVGDRKAAADLLAAAKKGDLEGLVYRTRQLKGGLKTSRLQGHQLRDHLGNDTVTDDGVIKYDPKRVEEAYKAHLETLQKAKAAGNLRGLGNL